MQKIAVIICLLLLSLGMDAQGNSFLRHDCLSSQQGHDTRVPKRLPTLKTRWDSTRVYPVAVVLVEFSDTAFSKTDPYDFYHRILNEKGYNEGKGPGCVADYLSLQSGGLFKPRFDVYGPVRTTKACNENGRYGTNTFRDAISQLAQSSDLDLTPYDWDNDGYAEATIFVYAGGGGNEVPNQDKNYIWPNTGSFSTLSVGNVTLTNYSASAELWSNGKSCGIGTICHEFSHTLGLPDLYPTSGSEYSVVDEWDLMDGGNFTNNGWCPPSYSVHEKMLLGWLKPEELSEPATIKGLKPLAEGGQAYIISTDKSTEFFLLENRQWSGWDLRSPGHGLLISHVDFSASAWSSNSVNSNPRHHCYELVHADNLDYNAWDDIIGNKNPYIGGHNQYLSTTPYPFVNDSVENRELTDTSVPAATVFSSSGPLSRPITEIVENDDATVSFVFMGGDPSGITERRDELPAKAAKGYDLTGRPVGPSHRGLVIKNGKLFFQ